MEELFNTLALWLILPGLLFLFVVMIGGRK